MSDVESDPEALKESYTPKQRENFEKHAQPKLDRLDALPDVAAKAGGDPEKTEEMAEAGKEWFLRTYRPKKRGDGLMERDHVKLGTPEHLFKKQLEDLNNPWGSFEGLMMASFGIDDDTQDEIQEAATAVWLADGLKNERTAKALQKKLREHDEVAQLYGVA